MINRLNFVIFATGESILNEKCTAQNVLMDSMYGKFVYGISHQPHCDTPSVKFEMAGSPNSITQITIYAHLLKLNKINIVCTTSAYRLLSNPDVFQNAIMLIINDSIINSKTQTNEMIEGEKPVLEELIEIITSRLNIRSQRLEDISLVVADIEYVSSTRILDKMKKNNWKQVKNIAIKHCDEENAVESETKSIGKLIEDLFCKKTTTVEPEE